MIDTNVPVIESSFERIQGYRFYHWRGADDRGRVAVRDRRGRTVVRITAELNVRYYKIGDLDGDGWTEIDIYTWSGGAHGSNAHYVLKLGPHPKCLLAFWKGNTNDDDLVVKDLDGDGRPELVSWSDGFAYRLGDGYAPIEIPQVLKLEHGRFEDATARFPGFLRRKAVTAWGDFLEGLASERGGEHRASATRVLAVGYLAPEMIRGHEAQAWRRLRPHMVPKEFQDLYRRRSWIRAVVKARRSRVEHPALRKLPLIWQHVYGPRGGWD